MLSQVLGKLEDSKNACRTHRRAMQLYTTQRSDHRVSTTHSLIHVLAVRPEVLDDVSGLTGELYSFISYHRHFQQFIVHVSKTVVSTLLLRDGCYSVRGGSPERPARRSKEHGDGAAPGAQHDHSMPILLLHAHSILFTWCKGGDWAAAECSRSRPKPALCILQAPVLFKLNVARPEAGWQKSSTNAVYKFYNANEDTARQTNWYLEIESADVDMLVEEAAEMQIDTKEKKAVFFNAESQSVFSVVFPSVEECRTFSDQYHNKLYENASTKGDVDLGNANEWYFQPADTEPMDWEPTEEPLPEPTTPKLGKQTKALEDKSCVATGVAMGAGSNSFLLQEGKISVSFCPCTCQMVAQCDVASCCALEFC